MANPNAPFGLRPLSRSGGTPFSLACYGKLATDTQAIFQFDPVAKAAGVAVPLQEAPTYNVPGVKSAYSAGLAMGSVFWVGVSINYGAASVQSNHFVVDEVDAIFLAQCATGFVCTTAAAAGKTANFLVSTPGNTLTRMSGVAIDGTKFALLNPGQDVWVREVSMIAPNQEGDSAWLELLINKHYYAAQPGTPS
jgi:hypothetical protein